MKTSLEVKSKTVHLITLDPGHFHAALVQKIMYDDVDSVVHVYASPGPDLQLHLERIKGYNTRADQPTHWNEEVYAGKDFFEKMIEEKKGNVVVLAGNNQKKTEYILKSLEAGFNVLADKPMAINKEGFEILKKAFETAKSKNLLLYDIMTERFEITTILQRELSMMPEVFGDLEKGTVENPAVVMESGHCFYKNVSGNIVIRPAWFIDASQQGEGIVDVTTHLVDLVQWECFPGQSLDYTKDITVLNANKWATDMNLSQFKTITKMDSIPFFLKRNVVNDTTLQVYSNGVFNYQIKGVNAEVTVRWDYQTPSGIDTHFSWIEGTKATLYIVQGPDQQYKPTLYAELRNDNPDTEKALMDQIKKLQLKYPGIEVKKERKKFDHGIIDLEKLSIYRYEVIIPDKYKEGHEAHFARVTENFLEYLKNKNIPEWEVPNMLAKYFVTTKALEIATSKK